jgi:lipoprotein NlpD
MKRYFIIFPALLAVLLGACASTGPAPVEDLSAGAHYRVEATRPEPRAAAANGGTYRVQRGDTLYSIAFRHGLDYRDLATWNGIVAPYTIYVGRELRLAAAAARPIARAAATAPVAPIAATAPSVKPTAAQPPKPAPFETVGAHAASVNTPDTPASASAPIAASTASTPASARTAAEAARPANAGQGVPPIPSSASVMQGDVTWRWPADGQLVGSYVGGDPTRQGIDIAGKAGDPVRAAADGTVVYSGNGLIGYGELIIVKHSPGFLSAYGHNSKRLVKEGDHVKAGQTIAEMGSSSASRDSLHFEIRKNGKPANPVDYLPRR